MSKPRMNQPSTQSGKLERHARTPHYSDDCDCRNCRRQRDRTALPLAEIFRAPDDADVPGSAPGHD